MASHLAMDLSYLESGAVLEAGRKQMRRNKHKSKSSYSCSAFGHSCVLPPSFSRSWLDQLEAMFDVLPQPLYLARQASMQMSNALSLHGLSCQHNNGHDHWTEGWQSLSLSIFCILTSSCRRWPKMTHIFEASTCFPMCCANYTCLKDWGLKSWWDEDDRRTNSYIWGKEKEVHHTQNLGSFMYLMNWPPIIRCQDLSNFGINNDFSDTLLLEFQASVKDCPINCICTSHTLFHHQCETSRKETQNYALHNKL
jgi:hypothetical protein